MSQRAPKRATKAEQAYVREMRRASALDLVGRGRAEVLSPDRYPEPLKRFLARERTMVHVKLSAAVKRKLELRSRRTGIPVEELVRRWIEQAIDRDAG